MVGEDEGAQYSKAHRRQLIQRALKARSIPRGTLQAGRQYTCTLLSLRELADTERGVPVIVFNERFKPRPPELTGLDSEAMTVDVTFVGGGKRVLQIPYTRKPKAVADIRPIVVEMHKEAFKMLGLRYRLEKGYYQQVAEILSGVAKKKWRSAPTSKKIAVVATVAGVGYIAFAVVQRLRRR